MGQAAAEDPEPQGVVTKAQGFGGTGQGPHVFKELLVPQCLPPLRTPERAVRGVEPRVAGLSESRDQGPAQPVLPPREEPPELLGDRRQGQFPREPRADALDLGWEGHRHLWRSRGAVPSQVPGGCSSPWPMEVL